MYLGNWQIDDFLTWAVMTHSRRGELEDNNALVEYRIYEDETTPPIVTGTMSTLDSPTVDGLFSERIQLTAASGFERGKTYFIHCSQLDNTISGIYGVLRYFQIGANATQVVVPGIIDDTAFVSTATQFETNIAEATADHYKDRVIIFIDGPLADAAKAIAAYSLVGGRGFFTMNTAFVGAPANGNRFIIV